MGTGITCKVEGGTVRATEERRKEKEGGGGGGGGVGWWVYQNRGGWRVGGWAGGVEKEELGKGGLGRESFEI